MDFPNLNPPLQELPQGRAVLLWRALQKLGIEQLQRQIVHLIIVADP